MKLDYNTHMFIDVYFKFLFTNIFTDCPSQADVAFLLDGSGSVNPADFERMKIFVKTLIRSFKGRDTKVILLLLTFASFHCRY